MTSAGTSLPAPSGIQLALMASLAAACLLQPHAAEAQSRPSAIVLQTRVGAGVEAESGARAARALRLRLEQLDQFELSSDSGMSLEDLQLAVGCAGESAACLSSVAQQLDVQVLIVPSVNQVGDQLIFGLTVFRAQGDSPMSTVTRRLPVSAGGSALLNAASSALDEAFGHAERAPVEPPRAQLPAPVTPPAALPRAEPARPRPAPPVDQPPVPLGPRSISWTVVGSVGGAGAGMLLLGGVLGLASSSSESSYNDARPTTRAEVDQALSQRSKAQRRATLANTFYVLGVAAVVTAGVLALLGRRRPEERQARLEFKPRIGPHSVALGLRLRLQ